ncbi:MAG: flagellar hook-length control protein FliK [Rickettsiales bacterium]
MQSAGVNALLAMGAGAAPNANAGTAASATDEGSSTGQQFSQLLSDSGTQYDGQNGAQQFTRGTQLPGCSSAGLSAQEVASDAADALAQLIQLREQMIAPEDAHELIKRIDKVLEQPRTTAADIQALMQIKEQLLAIQRTGEPKTIAQVLQAVSVKEAKLSIAGLTALLALKKTDASVVAAEEEALKASALVQSLQAAMFRADGKDKASAAATQIEPEEESVDVADATITLVQPLASQIVVPVQSLNDAARDSQLMRVRSDIDAAIPSLKQTDTPVLPDVELPKMNHGALARNEAANGTFQAMAAAVSEGTKPVDAGALMHDKGDHSVTSIMNPSHASGFTHTQSMSAAQPVSILQTHGYLNHAPVTDQVHVAISQASKDGIEHMTIQLDPKDLGRVEVSMSTGRDGHTQISFMVDKAETFDNLSRDARMLERSLQEAGIKADTGSMQFNLRQQPQGQQLQSDLGQGQGQGGAQQDANNASTNGIAGVTGSIAMDATTRNYLFNVREGVDISA